MFKVDTFKDVKKATEHIKKILAELESPETLDFQVIHSLSELECSESGGDWEEISPIILDYMRDLDAQNGYMIFNEEDDCWDYMEWDEDVEREEKPNIHKPKDDDEVFVEAGEGLTILYNPFAFCAYQFPIVVIKKSFYDAQSKRIFELLKYADPGSDYTTKISPAIYVEIFYNNKD